MNERIPASLQYAQHAHSAQALCSIHGPANQWF
jgi:hypothetical protein